MDIGIGTGTLSYKLYSKWMKITGLDFPNEMLRILRKKMPNAKLYLVDFKNGFSEIISNERYDFIISSYTLHHLEMEEKTVFINQLSRLLTNGGTIIIENVSFESQSDLEKCKSEVEDSGELWNYKKEPGYTVWE